MSDYKNKLLNLGKGLDIPEIDTLIDMLSPEEFFTLGQEITNTMKQIIENYHQLQKKYSKLQESSWKEMAGEDL